MAFIGNGAQLTDLDAGDIASGTLPVARGGTGTASPSLVGGTNITISGSWPNQTVTAAGGGVTSLNGQTGAVTDTNLGAIGSYVVATRGITIPTINSGNATHYTNSGTTVPGSELRYDANAFCTQAGNSYPGGGTALSGTWRAMQRNDRTAQFIPPTAYSGEGRIYCWSLSLWVRVS
jgi:hypothetical protein